MGSLFSAYWGSDTTPNNTDAIAKGRASWAAEIEGKKLYFSEIRIQNKGTFYAALGQRLLILRKLRAVEKQELAAILCEQCFRHGPREIDAAVFTQATEFLDSQYGNNNLIRDYPTRLDNSEDLRLFIRPLLHDLCKRLDLDW